MLRFATLALTLLLTSQGAFAQLIQDKSYSTFNGRSTLRTRHMGGHCGFDRQEEYQTFYRIFMRTVPGRMTLDCDTKHVFVQWTDRNGNWRSLNGKYDEWSNRLFWRNVPRVGNLTFEL